MKTLFAVSGTVWVILGLAQGLMLSFTVEPIVSGLVGGVFPVIAGVVGALLIANAVHKEP